ncbi:hypothetical protein [Paraflavitalea speifideaquila]|uniref:hypothetical protein n=1 Tax=Paraflavitalea speifideaquila TaxID=3076558 RepID=UPI0028E5DEFF|nr:hypothetical protein [Paraflavitalea speifideiaquila]
MVLNPSTILGYGDWNTSSCAIFKNSFREFPWYTNGVNGFVDVKDVAKAAVLLMNSSISAERFIVNADNWSFRQLLNTIAEGFNNELPSREATPFLGEVAWRMEKFKSLFSGKSPYSQNKVPALHRAGLILNITNYCRLYQGFPLRHYHKVFKKHVLITCCIRSPYNWQSSCSYTFSG